MAGSRYEKVGTIFSRVSGLLRSGAMKEIDKPIWFEIYKAFPPIYDPLIDRPVPKDEIKAILYEEDMIRARFYATFGSPGVFDVTNENSKSLSQRFVEKYLELAKDGQLTGDDIFKAVVDNFARNGIELVGEQKTHVKITIKDDEDLLVPAV